MDHEPSTGTPELAVVDLTSGSVTTTIALRESPHEVQEVTVAPDGRTAYVTYEESPLVSVVDTARDVVSGTITLPGPTLKYKGLAVAPDSRTLYVAGRLNTFVVDAGTGTATGTLPVTGDAAFSPDGATAYIADTALSMSTSGAGPSWAPSTRVAVPSIRSSRRTVAGSTSATTGARGWRSIRPH